MEIARVYLDEKGKIRILLSGKHATNLIIALMNKAEAVYSDSKSVERGEGGSDELEFNIELAGGINIATQERIEKIQKTPGAAVVRVDSDPPPNEPDAAPDKESEFFKE
jgi:hypothetical protein